MMSSFAQLEDFEVKETESNKSQSLVNCFKSQCPCRTWKHKIQILVIQKISSPMCFPAAVSCMLDILIAVDWFLTNVSKHKLHAALLDQKACNQR